MSIILEKQLSVDRILTISVNHAWAINDVARAKIIQLLYRKKLNAEQISRQLRKIGYKKALTTVRHHLEILKKSGLIEVVKIEESRGAMVKYYGTSIKLLDFEIPKDFKKRYSKLIKSTSIKLENILENISTKTTKNKSTNHHGFSQYLVMEIINHAITNVLEKKS